MTAHRHRRTARRAGALATAIALVAGGCMFDGDDDQNVSASAIGPRPVESGMPEDPKPTRGGQLVYGLEAETDLGFCLQESQLAASGLEIVRALYDPLTIPDGKGGYAPYLAKSVEPDETYKVWTITLRSGITFHDGTALDATVVKNNLDAYRGQYPGRSPLLFIFSLMDIAEVDVVNELTVRVTARKPWVAFPGTLYGSGRIAMVAQAQLDADTEDCAERPIGTGPFSFVSWERDVSLKVRRNAEYWQEAPDGKPYPYLEAIDFRPIPNTDARLAALQSGELNMLHTSSPTDMGSSLTQLRDEEAINLLVSNERTETSYLMMNVENKALADRDLRIAIAQAIDKDKLNALANGDFSTEAEGPFAPEVLGYLEDPGVPEFDLAAAKKGVAAAKAKGLPTELALLASTDTIAGRSAIVVRDMLEAAGLEITIETEAQSVVVQRSINGEYDLAVFRQQPGEDPDSNYHWWGGGGNPLNFGNFDDPVIDEQLEIGRTSPDPAKRKAAYEAINKQFAKQQWNVYLFYSPWAVAEASNVHGILGPPLPDDGGPPPARLVTGHALHGIWIDQD